MRTTFTIQIECDLPVFDDGRRKTFTKLMLETTRKYYALSAMLRSQMPVEVSIVMTDANGTEELDLLDPTIESGGK